MSESEDRAAVVRDALCIDDVCLSLNGCGCLEALRAYGDECRAAGRREMREEAAAIFRERSEKLNARIRNWASVRRHPDESWFEQAIADAELIEALPDHRSTA